MPGAGGTILNVSGVVVGGNLEQEYDARIKALREQYLAALPQRRADIAEHWCACAMDTASPAWRELQSHAHRLAGSAPCYGLDEVGEIAQRLDRLLSGKSPCRDAAVLAPLVARLLDALDDTG
ncbi:MAG: Hpt domain-containing protein [Rhodanobacteraceae bacterium]